MQRVRTILCRSLVVLAIAATAQRAKADDKNDGQPIRPTDGVIQLFDGKTLEGFYTWLKDTQYEDPRRVFRVTDGMLHVTGDGLGGLLSDREYRDYHLVLEFKWGQRTWEKRKTRTKDSGLLIHSTGADGSYNDTWMASIEVQMIEGGLGDFILVGGNDRQGKPVPLSLTCETDRDRDGEVIWKEGGRRETFDMQNRRRINWFGRDPDWKDVLGFRGAHDLDSPDGQWNRFDVICDGPHIEVFVNGVKANEAFDAYPSYGRIQIQAELAEVFIRRLELHPLDQGPKPAKAVQ